MVINKSRSRERKDGHQQKCQVYDCLFHWNRLNHSYTRFTDIMNMRTYRINNEHWCDVALTYIFKPNKW